jgi:hypothetical protein
MSTGNRTDCERAALLLRAKGESQSPHMRGRLRRAIGAAMGAVGCRYHATESAPRGIEFRRVGPRERPVHLQLPLLQQKRSP